MLSGKFETLRQGHSKMQFLHSSHCSEQLLETTWERQHVRLHKICAKLGLILNIVLLAIERLSHFPMKHQSLLFRGQLWPVVFPHLQIPASLQKTAMLICSWGLISPLHRPFSGRLHLLPYSTHHPKRSMRLTARRWPVLWTGQCSESLLACVSSSRMPVFPTETSRDKKDRG